LTRSRRPDRISANPNPLERRAVLNLRRGILWTTSIVTGLIASVGIILLFQTTLEKFSVSNALLIFFSIGSLTFIWLDLLLGTNYLRK
jgi:hypothetical protein